MEVKATHASEGECQVYCVDGAHVAEVQSAMPGEEAFEQVAEEFSALSDPTRLKILFALSERELCVCDLAQLLGRSMPATSQQLQRLRRMGLVRFRMSGKLAIYRLESPLARLLVREALERRAKDGR
ncbi:MAG: winged helix-turn-helix transcriptional regulator [Myxococcales bacterium]|nr:winged helix-turn-helix transcriptional regulator [Myxococcales bacterium]MBK7580098.1 winged helix-turn-helix transcriptional regulator [Myxococcales bacterium]MCC6898728.1 winged helix-turn-helix transcriptional regulator [Polyangiaceae bacterium]